MMDEVREDTVNDFTYLQALESRQRVITAERDEAAEAIKSVAPEHLTLKTLELQQLEADSARIWSLLKGARGKSSRA